MLKFRKLSNRLLISFLIVGIIPALIIAICSLFTASASLKKVEYIKLESIRDTKAAQVEDLFSSQKESLKILQKVVNTYKDDGYTKLETITSLKKKSIINYFDTIRNDLINLSKLDITKSALNDLKEYLDKYDNKESLIIDINNNNFSILKRKIDQEFKKVSLLSKPSTIYLIDTDTSKLIYSSGITQELGKNLNYGSLSHTPLAKTYKSALEKHTFVLEDFDEYTPANSEMSLFTAIPVMLNNKTYVLAARYNKTSINKLMKNPEALGSSGETYLAGTVDDNESFRSDLQTIGEGKFIVGYNGDLNLEYWKSAFNGERVKKIFTDSQGKLVMVIAEPLFSFGLNWIIVTKMNLEEIIDKKLNETSLDIYQEFTRKFNFSDLFLIHPNGEVFYSVKKKDDYHRNILYGKYSDSNLAQLVKNIESSKKYEITDFSLYEALNKKAAGFIGIPIIENNEIIMIIAAEFLGNKINDIMKSSKSSSYTNETYLVGSDYLIKSDSSRDKTLYSLENSLDMPEKTKIKTDAVLNALNEINETLITRNYLNEKVISSYSKLNIDGLNWLIISEISTKEAFQSVETLRYMILTVAILGILGIIMISYRVTREISKPIKDLENWAKQIALGNNELAELKTTTNEFSNLNDSFTSVVFSIREATAICKNMAIGNFSKSFNIRSKNDPLGNAINQMRTSFLEVITQANQLAEKDFSVEISKRSDEDDLAIALINLVDALKISTEQNERDSWIKTGQSELNNLMREEKEVLTLTTDIITFLCKYSGAEMGALFIEAEQKETFMLNSSYAYTSHNTNNMSFKKGEGVLGQVLIDEETFVLNNLPDDYISFKSGLGNTMPNNIIVIPCIYNKEVKAVIELAFLKEINNIKIDFLNLISESIAIALHTSEAKENLNILLNKTLKQSDELQHQQETLKQTNEELEEQTQKLLESEKFLQQQQEELKQTNEELEEQTLLLKQEKEAVGKQNKELVEIRSNLEEKSTELLKSSKYKSEFLANMSHELRTPLNSILILAKLLSENKYNHLDNKEIEKVQTIYRSGHDLLDLINEVLDLSKIEAGKTELEIKELELIEAVEFYEKSFKAIADEKNLEFKLRINDDIPPIIKTDERKLNQIIKNLLSNAFKFTEKGSVSLNIYGAINNSENMIVFEIRDTGIGIPNEVQTSIFEAFKQADGSTNRKYGGTGLGLSITKNLAALLGGFIELTSIENHGSSFKVYLPLKEDKSTNLNFSEIQENLIENKVKITENNPIQDLEKINDDRETLKKNDKVVLIVEDDTDFANVLLELSREKGYKGIISLNGHDAIDMVEKYYPQGILLDLGLPDVDGWTVLGKIKNNLKNRHIPVYIISGNENAGLGLKLGAAGFIKKPAELEELYEAFDKLEFINEKEMRNILVIEDNFAQLEMLSEVFSKSKLIHLESAKSGNEAIEMINRKKYDCIVLDLSLPDINGMKLLEVLNKTGKIEDTPIIVYTARELTQKEKKFLELYSEKIIIKSAESHEELLDQVTLFLHIMEDNLSDQNKKIIKDFKEKGSEFQGKKVLIVDDDIRNIFALTSVLEEKDIEVLTAENGKNAIEVLELNPDIDMIIMDIMMPIMNGYEAMKQIRQFEKFKSLPIIALTAKAMKDDYRNCIEAGASDYLTKPLNVERLLSLMQVWLYKSF